MNRLVISLDSESALQPQHAGGKGASLAWLRKARFQVPPGFVVTTAAFDAMLASLGIRPASLRGTETPEELEQIRRRVAAYTIPSELAAQIEEAYRELETVAVRSSMVGEDSAVASFAGQLDTELQVHGIDAVLAALTRCWASLFNWRLFQYLSKRGAEMTSALPENLTMAVVVQQMVDAEDAGVAFSADPVSGQDTVVIEAARGLGDAVVQGLVQPDRYVVDARHVVSESDLVDKVRPVLQEESILRLAALVRDVAAQKGCEQDIEWALDGAGFHLLQCRPITALERKDVFSNRMVAEMVPGLIKPLVWSTNTISMIRNVFGRIFGEVLGDAELDCESLVKRIHSRIYVNMTWLGGLFGRLGMPANFFEMMTRDERAQRRRFRPSRRNLGAIVRLLRFVLRHSRVVADTTAFVDRHQQELEPYRQTSFAALGAQELLVQYEALARLHGETQWFVFIGPINMGVRNRITTSLVERHAPDVVPSDLIRGLAGLKALEPNEQLEILASQAAGLDLDTRGILAEGDDATIRKVLSSSDQGQALLQGVEAYLDRYGFLSASGTDFAGTSWSEEPDMIWHCIGRSAGATLEPRTEDVAASREASRRRVRDAVNPLQRWMFDRLLDSTVALVYLREQVSLLMSEDAFHMRRIFLTMAEQFVARGQLLEQDDIFFLTYGELQELADGRLESKVVKERVATRKLELERDAQIEPPETICGEEVLESPVPLAESPEYLVGIRGSSGVASGRACIVLDPSKAPLELCRDDMLVVPFTDVGWTPLLSGIGGIVAETGGQLSHTAIVAREYGLPAVVSVKQATRLIQDGQRLTVDGNQGRVLLGGE